MKKKLFSRILSIVLCFMLSAGVLVTADQQEVSAAYKRYVTVDFLNIRKSASASASVLGKYYWKDEVTCIGTNSSWTKVSFDGKSGYVKTKYLSKTLPVVTYESAYKRYAKESIKIRKTPSTGSASLGSYSARTKITCYGTSGNWTVVKKNGEEGFVLTKYLSKTAIKVTKGEEVAKYALRFVGNPYVYGGTSLTNGADCSGFTMSVYKHFGYSIPRTSSAQRSAGKKVSWSNKKPGDLICYYGHVAIYIGNNTVVHASNRKTGIKTTSPANYRSVACVRRIVNE
ncbi:MAG: NlpC/P60 family protein [Lachnospiraceae bacterium]|nr:NlpC/P60 family protein [Lachnospiraceae bacterium]